MTFSADSLTMVMCNSQPRLATQPEQVRNIKLAGKVMKQKINPKLIDGRTLTLFKKGEELATLCNARVAVLIYGSNGSVQTWPNNSNTVKDILKKYKQAVDKKVSNRSFKSMKHKVAETNAEGLDQNICFEGLGDDIGFELRDEELEKLSQDSLMDLTAFVEFKEHDSDKAISLIEDSSQPIEGSQSIDHPDNNSNCNPPIELAENVWEDLLSEDFDKGQTLLTDSTWPWQAYEYTGFESFDTSGIDTSTSNSLVYHNDHNDTDSGDEQLRFLQASGDFENYCSNSSTDIWTSSALDYHDTCYLDFPTVIPDSSSTTNLEELGGISFSNGGDELRIKNNVSLEDFEFWLNVETMTVL